MARLIVEHDWSASLGSLAAWPALLKTTVGFMLQSPIPIVLLWGEPGIMIYNDAYSVFAGARHPSLLGSRVREGWPEVADFNDNVMRVGLAGGTLSYRDQELVLNRTGKFERGWMDLGYSPVVDEDGVPAGVIAIVVETTERVLAARRAAAEEQRQRSLLQQLPGFVGVVSGPDHVFEYVNDAYVQISERDEFVGRRFREVFPDIMEQGFLALLDQVYRTGVGVVSRDTPLRLHAGATLQYVDFVFEPVRDEAGAVTGVFMGGYEVTEVHRAQVRRDTLVRLSDRLRDLDDEAEIAGAAAEVLGEALEAGRVGWGVIDPATDTMFVARDWTAPGVASQTGATRLRDFGSFIESLKRNEYLFIPDVREDPRTSAPEHVAGLARRGVLSFVNAPVVERGELVGVLFVADARVRTWTAEDEALIRETAQRLRVAMERARSQAALRESERRLRFLDDLARTAAESQDADAILAITTRRVAEHLGVTHCAYADMDEDQDGFTIRGDWTAPGLASIVGHYSLAAFGGLAVAELSAGRPLIIHDNTSELPSHEAAMFQSLGISATICMPLIKEGRLTALMAIHNSAPHRWSEHELAVIREVTERSWAHIARVRAEADVRASEENFRTLARAMPNQVWTAQPDGGLDWFNEQVYAYSGADEGSLDGAQWTQIVHRDDVPAAAARWRESLSTSATYEVEFRLRRHDGSWRWHVARAVPIIDAFGQVVRWIGANTDIHDQKEIATALSDINTVLETRVEERTRQLVQTQDALRQAQKMEAVGQLTGGIAHDFNNLLTGISGSLELLERRIGEGKLAGVERYIDAAQGASRRAAALTQRLLAFSRRQTLDPKPVDVNRLIAGMEDLVRRSVGPNIEVEVVGAGGLWTTRIDPSQLENSLLNLCINGRDAMAPDGGRLTIETANKWLDERAAKERDLPPGQYVSLCVTDTGTGMTPEVKERAFDPFYTTKPLGEGTGLGLSMIYGFVRQSGGQVRIYTEIGKGTTMCLYLPRYVGEAAEDEAAPQEIAHPGHGETVLVIDDEEVVRMLIVDVLEENGYAALEAMDGASGLKILESAARIDLLITDVGLPGGMNGRQVADAARRLRPELKVLFVTGYAENAVVGNGHLERGMEIITKRFATAALGLKIRDLIDRA